MSKNQKLELTWIGKDQRPKLEPRILIEDPEKSYHAKFRTRANRQEIKEAEGRKENRQDAKNAKRGKTPENLGDLGVLAVPAFSDLFDNRLIFGDNLLALKALEQEFTGKIKCAFIDPPYNTGSAFSHYDDGVEHSLWLSLIRDRLELLRQLLAEDGALWITIDDVECHYLKVIADEVFGRSNFVANVIWQKKYAPQPNAIWLSESHDHILLFAKNKEVWRPNNLPRTVEMDARYKNLDNDPRGPWKPSDFTISLTGGQRGAQFAKTGVSANIYEIKTPSGRKLFPTKGRCWAASPEKYKELLADGRLWFGASGNNVPAYKRFLSEVQEGTKPQTIWLREEVGDNQDSKREVMAFNSEDIFSTPKPEFLIKRIIEIGSNSGDWILDSFAGSGTTGAVAHKMGRRWIMVELGEHCHTHIIPRLKKVINGEDKGGISEAVGWKGGGGFRYYRLGPSLLKKDEFNNWVISKEYNAAMLAEAMCKLEGFTYAPSDAVYWQHGHSTENDFIYVTTQTLTREQLQKLSDEVGESRSLLVMCGAFRAKNLDEFPNLTVKKIPKAVLTRCEWGHDDYSLEIKNLPMKAPEPEDNRQDAKVAKRTKEERRATVQQPTLFDMTETNRQDAKIANEKKP